LAPAVFAGVLSNSHGTTGDMTQPTLEGDAEPPRARADYRRIGSSRDRRGVTIRGLPIRRWTDLYHRLLTISWGGFLLLWICVYLAANLIFATLFWLDRGGLSGARPGAFEDAFFFSVQTLGTIGYGAIAPKSLFANTLVALESFFSFGVSALSTGLIFARVSRPTARVMFSRHAVVTLVNGVQTLMFRAANERRNQVLEAEVTVTLARNMTTLEGVTYKAFQGLTLKRSRSPFFALSWTVMHAIDETSPLFGQTLDSLIADKAEIVVVLAGVDETLAQRIHARHSYLPHEIVWDQRFADIIQIEDDGRLVVEYGRFHDLQD
jgi:inward rectifier potassium channel